MDTTSIVGHPPLPGRFAVLLAAWAISVLLLSVAAYALHIGPPLSLAAGVLFMIFTGLVYLMSRPAAEV